MQNAPYSSGKNVEFLEPEVIEKKNWSMKHVGFAIVLAFVLVLVQFGVTTLLESKDSQIWILAFSLVIFFGVVVY